MAFQKDRGALLCNHSRRCIRTGVAQGGDGQNSKGFGFFGLKGDQVTRQRRSRSYYIFARERWKTFLWWLIGMGWCGALSIPGATGQKKSLDPGDHTTAELPCRGNQWVDFPLGVPALRQLRSPGGSTRLLINFRENCNGQET